MIGKVIWIRCQEEYEIEEIRVSIFNFINEDQSLAGDIPVRVFSKKGFSTCSLSHVYDMSESAVNVLKERFGAENVKLCKREVDNGRPDERSAVVQKNEATNISLMDELMGELSYICEKHHMTRTDAIEVLKLRSIMEIERCLNRIDHDLCRLQQV